MNNRQFRTDITLYQVAAAALLVLGTGLAIFILHPVSVLGVNQETMLFVLPVLAVSLLSWLALGTFILVLQRLRSAHDDCIRAGRRIRHQLVSCGLIILVYPYPWIIWDSIVMHTPLLPELGQCLLYDLMSLLLWMPYLYGAYALPRVLQRLGNDSETEVNHS